MQIGCQIGCSKVSRALILMILVTFVLNTLQRAPALQGSPQGRLQLGPHPLNIKFLVQIFSIPWLSHLRPPSAAALFAVRLFFLVGFSQSFVSNFSLGRHFLWHWMKIFLSTMTANWIHCAGMFPKFYLTFECRATMRQYLSLILSVYLSESGWSSILQFLQAFCQSDTNLKTIWTLSCVTRCHESCVTCDGGCPGPVTLMFPDNLQRCFVNNASYEEKMHSMR